MPHVEIAADRPTEVEAALAPLATTLISARTLEAAHTPSLLPTLQAHVPSLFATGRGILGYGLSTGAAGTLKIRGVGGEKSAGVLVVMDDEPMVQGLMGHTLADMYQSLAAQRVEVVRGPASVRYGSDALGGVVQIRTSAAEGSEVAPATHLRAQAAFGPYQTLNSALHLQHATPYGLDVTAAGSYDRTDGHRAGLDFEQASAFVRAAQRAGEHWRFTAQGYGTHFVAGNPGTVASPLWEARAEARRGLVAVAAHHDYEALSGQFRLYYSLGDHHIDDGHGSDEAPADYRFRSRDYIAGMQVDETLRPGRHTTVWLGAALKRHGGRAWNEPLAATHHAPASHASTRSYLVDTALWSAGAYLGLTQEVGSRLTLDGGLRYELDEASGGEWVPQVGASWRMGRTTRLRALASRGFRAPSLRELYLWAAANPDLKPEHLVNYELGVERWWCRHRLRTQVTLYTLRATNLIETTYLNGRAQNRNLGHLRNRGVEAEVEWQLSRHWHYATTYSYLDTSRPVTAAPRHKWHQELVYETTRWRVAPAFEYVGHLYTATDPISVEHYGLLHLDVELRPAAWLQLFARGENLLGQRYETLAGYPMPRATATGGVRLRW
jgi:outer membrane cobalamin receptor